MLAAQDVELARETARALRAQGQDDRARAVEAVLAAALSAERADGLQADPGTPPPAAPVSAPKYLTITQAARAVGTEAKTLREWIKEGQFPTSVANGRQVID